MNYKYHLLKYKGKQSRLTCPQCGRHHCFTPYVDCNDKIVGEEYGRCDHESSCGYVKYPPSEEDWREYAPQYRRREPQRKSRIVTKPVVKLTPESKLGVISPDIVKRTVASSKRSDFITFLLTLLDEEAVARLINEYQIGVTKAGDVIFYQIDQSGRCRTGKVMRYNPITGKRVKDESSTPAITWVHSLLKQQGVLPNEWELTQCLFGEHLLKRYPEKVVCLVESEKTAIICAGLCPDAIWLATGGKGQLNDRVEVLDGRKILAFPDIDGYDTWCEKANERPYLNIIVSDLLKRFASEEDYEAHIDIADILIRWRQGKTLWSVDDDDLPPRQCQFMNNPAMEEIMKFLSTEYWNEVDVLIREFDLEVVGITKSEVDMVNIRY